MCPSSTRTSATEPAIRAAQGAGEIEQVRALFLEYQRSLGVSLCFQGFDAELASLPGAYAPPRGGLWIARIGDDIAGCVALRPLGENDAELKRLYVRPAFRGRAIGKALTTLAVGFARSRGYAHVKLDTLPSMAEARKLYEQLGFVEVPAYYANPVPGVRYLALAL